MLIYSTNLLMSGELHSEVRLQLSFFFLEWFFLIFFSRLGWSKLKESVFEAPKKQNLPPTASGGASSALWSAK